MFQNRIFLLFFLLFFHPSNGDCEDTIKYLGVGSCASSNCHGQVTGSATSNVLRNEFSTWYKFDQHAQGYKSLLSEESKRIAYHLGLGEPHREKLCLDCHATNAKLTGERFSLEDGVGCESCHGASEGWLKSHVEANATHEKNVQNGLRDLADLQVRASLCASCHFGDDSKEVTHQLYGAGHPRLSFEQDTYEAVQPRHWRIDEDYKKRKAEYSPTEGWLRGQFALAEAQLKLLSRHTHSDGPFPEFNQFSCFSCHQPLTEKSFMSRARSESTGLPHINTTHLDMISIALDAARDSLAESYDGSIRNLQSNFYSDDSKEKIEEISEQLSKLKKSVRNPDPKDLIKSLQVYAKDTPDLDFQRAEQVVMAIASANEEAKIFSKEKLKKLYKAVENPSTFSQKSFRKIIN